MSHGYYLRTTATPTRHRLAGPRADHADIAFPICPRCRFHESPVLRIDFDDPPLTALGLWRGVVVLLVCHNGCRPSGEPTYAWEYRRPEAPVLLDPAAIDDVFGPAVAEDWEFEGLYLELVSRGEPDPDLCDTETRVGGEPSWLQSDPDLRCPGCSAPVAMLAQWSETGMDHLPRRLGVSREQIMGNPFIRFWFGCAACRVILTYDQLD